MNIRPATPADLDGCVLISQVPEFSYLYVLPTAEVKAYLQVFLEEGILFVAEESNEIVGFLTAELMLGNFGWIDGIVVKESMKGKGIEKRLLSACRDRLRVKGVEHLFLVAPKQNQAAVDFYKSADMQQGNEFIEFYEKL